MRINNPKSFAGFALNGTLNDNEYKLATVGQVQTAIGKIRDNFIELLKGEPGSVSDTMTRAESGWGGIAKRQGYAWLGADGKIEPQLLPALAITETYVIPQNELSVPSVIEADTVYLLLNEWVQEREGDIAFQKGDILIITPMQSKATNTTELSASFEEFDQKIINPAYSGTYIITDVVKDSATQKNNYTFAKIAYTDSNIVSINDCAPGNSTGQLTIYLRDILKAKTPLADADELEKVVYRLGRTNENRFQFLEGTENSVWVPYAKLEELEQEIIDRNEAVSGLQTIVENYKALLDAKDQSLTRAIDKINEEDLGSRLLSSDMLTDDMRDPSTATVYEQLTTLRYDVDYNAEILHKTKTDTNALLTQIQSNVNSLFEHLDGKAVAIIEKQFNWRQAVVSEATDEFEAIPVSGAGTVQGTVIWEYDYVSPTSGELIASPNKLDGLKTSYENNDPNDEAPALQQFSQERIIAVFDPNGEKVDVDIKSSKDDVTGIYHQILRVQTDWFGNESNHNSILSDPWTMLISKTIVGISNVQSRSIRVGDKEEKRYLDRVNWTD